MMMMMVGEDEISRVYEKVQKSLLNVVDKGKDAALSQSLHHFVNSCCLYWTETKH